MTPERRTTPQQRQKAMDEMLEDYRETTISNRPTWLRTIIDAINDGRDTENELVQVREALRTRGGLNTQDARSIALDEAADYVMYMREDRAAADGIRNMKRPIAGRVPEPGELAGSTDERQEEP